MMREPLPLLLSIPHGGSRIPPEVADRVRASPGEIFEDGDAFTPAIYDVGARVVHVQVAEVARAVVDLNRAPDDRAPANPDGVVKTTTCHGNAIYHEPLDEALTEGLLARYYHPYHSQLAEAAGLPGLRLGLDCHSMAPTPPLVAPDRGAPRPLFCVSNGEGHTCDDALLDRLASCLARAFDCPPAQVTRNRPFKGGYITRHHAGNPLPWIQIEMNRSLYLRDPWFDPVARRLAPERSDELRQRFADALSGLFPG